MVIMNVDSKYCMPTMFLTGRRIPLRIKKEAICVYSGKELAYILSKMNCVG